MMQSRQCQTTGRLERMTQCGINSKARMRGVEIEVGIFTRDSDFQHPPTSPTHARTHTNPHFEYALFLLNLSANYTITFNP